MANSNEVRIIAGQWRGRKLRFPAGTTIRPTPDRVRETLFNWLAPHIRGSQVLDLFAGSGALGVEALSRGARAATFVESDARCVESLRAQLAQFGAEGAEVLRADAMAWLAKPAVTPFDIVFVDPPFAAGVWSSVCARLERGGFLAAEAFIYLETPRDIMLDSLPRHWLPWREGKAGDVGYHLLRRGAVTGEGSVQAS
jgi:16S rRNA (guanine966-N2)-methyltransferase